MKHQIGIDARMLHHSGIGTYLRGLLDGLSAMNLPLEKFCLFGTGPSDYPPFAKSIFDSKIYSITEQLQYPGHLSKCELWHSPHYNIPILKGKTHLVVTFHDLIHWIFRKDFFTPLQAVYAGFMLRRAVGTADHIIAVSQKTKDDLVAYFQARPEKISVIYEGVGSHFRPLHDPGKIRALKQKYNLPESFFLYIGMLKPHKNVHGLLRIFRAARKNKKMESGLVIVGKKDRSYRSEFGELAGLKSEGGIHYIPYADAEDLVSLYNAALALVHPSLYEGFGLTLLEAMACGTPVIACRVASIPEIAGDAAYLVEPGREEALEEAMQRMEREPSLRQELILKGHNRVDFFSWNRMAGQTFAVYQKVLNGN